MCNRDSAYDVDIYADEKIAKRVEPTNQAQTKINITKGLKTYLDDSKNLTTYQEFKIQIYFEQMKKHVSKHTFFVSTLKLNV